MSLAIYDEIQQELRRAREKHGPQGHLQDSYRVVFRMPTADHARDWCQWAHQAGVGTWRDIFVEEVCEATDEADAGNTAALREELIQVAAVCVGWIDAIDGRDSQ